MDRLAELSLELTAIIDDLQAEAVRRNVRELRAPLEWLAEAQRWLDYELARIDGSAPAREAVPFTYIPIDLRK